MCSLFINAQDTEKVNILLEVPKDRIWYITDFGAKGDGETLNTLAIQKTIDACNIAGGGTVRVTPGTYLTGTLFLKDGVRLLIDANAVIMGSKDRQDYQFIQKLNIKQKPAFGDFGSFLIYAEDAKNISIEGKGEIDGNGETFWKESPFIFRDDIKKRRAKEWRPLSMICFVNCQFINIQDIFLHNSPCYTVWSLGCDDVKIEGVTIRNPIDGPNTDGFDIDCCRRVFVANCNIEGGDDAIAIKSDSGKLGEDRPCENIVVTNCILSSPPACAVRIGYEGDSPIRNCSFSNLTIYNSHHGLDIISILPDGGYSYISVFKGTRVENIQFDNIIMQNVIQPIYLWMGNRKKDTTPWIYLKNIRISNILASDVGDSFIGSTTENNIENIFLSNIYLNPTRYISKDKKFYYNIWYKSENPYVLYIHNVSGLYIDGFTTDFSKSSGFWKHAIYCENSDNVVLDKISTKSKGKVKLVSQIGIINSSIQIMNCIKEKGVNVISTDNNSHVISYVNNFY